MALRKAGVTLSAESVDSFLADLGRANGAVTDFGEDATKASKGVDKLGSATEKSGSKVGGFFKTAFSMATGGLILRAVDGITGSIGGLVGGMIGGNAAFEGYNTRFETMLGSAEEAKTRMAELAEFGAKTPFELPQVVEADTVLQGFGLHSEEAAKKFGFSGAQIRTIAGDVASGTGTDFKEMSLLIGKFSAGSTGEAISRMMELGITNREELTKMGLEFDKSGSLLSPLPQAMNTVMGLMQDKYGGLMEAQSSTFSGMVSNLQDWKDGTLRTIGAPIFDVLKDQLGNLLGFLNDPGTMAAMNGFATSLASGIGTAMTWLTDTAIPAMVGAWNTVTGVFDSVVNGASRIVDAFQEGGIGGAFSHISSLVASVWPTVQAHLVTFGTNVLTWIGEQAPLWAAQLLTWGEAFIGWIAPYIPVALAKLGEFATAAWGWFTEQAPILLEKAKGWGNALVDWIQPMIPPLLAKAGELAASLWGWVLDQAPVLLDKLQTWGESLTVWLPPKAKELLGKATALGKEFIGWITEQAAPILAKLKVWGEKLVEWIVPATKDFLSKWPVMFDQFLSWIGAQAGPLLKKLGDWAVSLIAWILPMIPPFLLAVAGIAAALLVWVGETAGVLAKKIVTEWVPGLIDWIVNDAIPKLGPALGNVLTTIGGWITTAAGTIATKALEIGSSLVAGIQDGISSAWETFLGWIDRQIARIPKAIRDALGIHSPARVMIPLGEAIPLGLIQGIQNQQDYLRTVLVDALSAALAASKARIETDGAAIVSAMNAMVDAYNAALSRIQQPLFFGGYAGGRTPWDTGDTGGTYTNFKPQLGALPMIRPPARPGEMVAMNTTTTAYGPTYNWSPTYNNANRVPEQDYYMQRALSS